MKSACKKWFWLSAAAFFLSSATIPFMQFGSFQQENKKPAAYILAAVFWIGFILGFAFLRPVSKQRRKDRSFRDKGGIPLLRFFSNKPAMVFDILMAVGLVCLLLTFIIRTLPGWLSFAGLFALMFSIEMHGLFNGKNYVYLCDRG